MNAKTFSLGLRTVLNSSQYTKKMKDDEVGFLFMLLPKQVKEQVTDEMWVYACRTALNDPTPNLEIAVHMRLLSYIYRVENGMPNFDWGIKVNDQALMQMAAPLPELPGAE